MTLKIDIPEGTVMGMIVSSPSVFQLHKNTPLPLHQTILLKNSSVKLKL